MRTFVKDPKAPVPGRATKSGQPNRAVARQGTGGSIRHIQRTLGNRVLQRLLRPEGDMPDTIPQQLDLASRTDSSSLRPVLRKCCSSCSQEPTTDQVPEIRASHGAALAPPMVRRAERTFGHDFSNVQIHTDNLAARATARVQARAFTVDNHIYFGAGEYTPQHTSGLGLLGHELTHVVQQRRGLAAVGSRATRERYEHEAEQGGLAFERGDPMRVRINGGPSGGLQRAAEDAYGVGAESSPYDWEFLGEANSPAELDALLAELGAMVGGRPLTLLAETPPGEPVSDLDAALTPPATGTTPVQRVPQRSAGSGRPIQRAVVAGCNVPLLTPGAIGVAAHIQLGATCPGLAPGCSGGHPGVPIPGDGAADLVRNPGAPPLIVPEIGEIKPASWLGLNLTAVAETQLAGYMAAWTAAHGVTPMPMFSVVFPPAPFALNPRQILHTWGPQRGIYYYSCRTPARRRRPRRVPVPHPVPVPVPVTPRVPVTRRSGVTGADVAKGAAATGATIGIGYVIYRGVRMIPSLFPAFWATIPANAAIP